MDFNNASDSYNYSWFDWCSCGDLSWCDLFCSGDMYGCGLNNFFSDPTVLAPGRTLNVGQGQCQEKFFMVGRSIGRMGVGRQRALSDGGRTEVFTSF